MRTMISSTIGQYADQRPMQAAMDECSPIQLRARHDDSSLRRTHLKIPANFSLAQLKTDDEGRVWLDFIADGYSDIDKKFGILRPEPRP